MPPNLGGFFMVRSYYPSECHADYFDFERIEALKPAIEACGISTLSQSPMLGDRKSGSAGMPRPISYAVFCLKKKKPRTHTANGRETILGIDRSYAQRNRKDARAERVGTR